MELRNLTSVKEMWRVYEEEGQDAAVDALLAICHEDVEFRLYAANGQVICGADELRAFYRRERAAGSSVRAAAYDFEEEGDVVVVYGWVRVKRPGGSLADSQVRWTYGFRDGRLATFTQGPLVGSASAA